MKNKMLVVLGLLVLVALFIGVRSLNIKNQQAAALKSDALSKTVTPEQLKTYAQKQQDGVPVNQEYTPQPAVVVFTKDSKLDEKTKEDIRKQIAEQSKKAASIPFETKPATTQVNQEAKAVDPQVAPVIPAQLHIIEGQGPMQYSFNGVLTNWFKLLEKSYGTSDGVNWSIKSANEYNNPLLSRYVFPATFLNNNIYIASGWNGYGGGCVGDVWHSPTGKGWIQDTKMAPWVTSQKIWDGRFEHTLTTFNSKMYLIGGTTCYNVQLPGDVWSSTNGSQWNQLTTNNSVIGQRTGHTTTVFKGKMYVIGGFTLPTDGFKNDVVSSSDGITWQTETTNAPWSRRGDHSAFVLNNKMYVAGGHYQGWPQFGIEIYGDSAVQYQLNMGGAVYLSTLQYFNDVWSSIDGVKWVEEKSEKTFSARRGHSTDVIGNKVYMVGGSDAPAHYLSDVFSSTDGKAWSKIGNVNELPDLVPVPFAEHASVVTPLNFGSTMPYDLPVFSNWFPYYYNGNILTVFGGIFSNAPQTNLSTDYKGFGSLMTYQDWMLLNVGTSNLTNQGSVSSGFVTFNLPALNSLVYPFIFTKISITNSVGTKVMLNVYSQCTPSTSPRITLKPLNNGNPVTPGQSYLLEWMTCNIASNVGSLNAGIINSNTGGWYQYFGLANDGNETVTIPSNLAPGSNYYYAVSYTNGGTNNTATNIPVTVQ